MMLIFLTCIVGLVRFSLILLQQYEAPPPERSKYVESDDSVVLEDDSGRIAITGIIPVDRLVSGSIRTSDQ